MKIYLVAKSTLENGINEFLTDRDLTWTYGNDVSDAELIVEAAGRVCYMSFGEKQYRKTTREYISNILIQGHESVLEHASFSILADGITRALTHQLVRHRIGFAYSQLSQQYHDESQAKFVEPEYLEDNPLLKSQWQQWCKDTHELHAQLLNMTSKSRACAHLSEKEKNRYSRSVARSVLPNATSTTLMITGNARAWRNFLTNRGEITGDPEMRNYCVSVYQTLMHAAPLLFSGFEILEDSIGPYVHSKPV